MPAARPSTLKLAQIGFVFAGLLGAIALFVRTAHAHYPLQHWLFFRYATYALASTVFGAGCLSSGHALLRTLLGRVLPVREQLAIAFPLGLLAYFWLAFVAGLLGLLGPAFFFGAPLFMLVAGAKPALRYARRLTRHVRHARTRALRPTHPLVLTAATALGLVAVAMIHFSILSPTNAAYDARWYHLPIAEQYASSGHVFRFPEGWVLGTYPQLASLVYAWGFMAPWAQLFDRIEMAAHLEFLIFLWTLFAVPALARRLLPRSKTLRLRMSHAWTAVFLFPGLFLYDSSLNMGADHFAALWAVPIALMLFRAWPKLPVRECCVLTAMLAGALLTKYTAIMIAGVPILAIVLRAVYLLAQGLLTRRAIPWRGPIAAGVLGLALTSAHWAKNLVWYGDPLYPQLHEHLKLTPWLPQASLAYHTDIAVSWHAPYTWDGLLEAGRVMLTFAFTHHDWPDLHRTMPIFGLLFTLTMFCLPFLGRAPRLWSVYALANLGVLAWALISWQERYLQVLVPWMAAGVACVLALAWHLHALTRVAAGVLVLLQIVWGGDVYFYTTHRMMRNTPAIASIQLLNSGREEKYSFRDSFFNPLQRIGKMLPDGSVVLMHGSQQTLGIKHRRVHDSPGTQGGIVYETMKSPREVYDALRAMGVTHIVWESVSEGRDTITGDIAFYELASRYSKKLRSFADVRVSELPKKPPPAVPFPRKVAYLSCQGRYQPGLYDLHDLTVPVFVPPKSPKPLEPFSPEKDAPKKMIEKADYLVFQPDCTRGVPTSALSSFEVLARRGTSLLYARKLPKKKK